MQGKEEADAKDMAMKDSLDQIQDLQKELQKVNYQIQPILCKPPMKKSALHASNSDLLYAEPTSSTPGRLNAPLSGKPPQPPPRYSSSRKKTLPSKSRLLSGQKRKLRAVYQDVVAEVKNTYKSLNNDKQGPSNDTQLFQELKEKIMQNREKIKQILQKQSWLGEMATFEVDKFKRLYDFCADNSIEDLLKKPNAKESISKICKDVIFEFNLNSKLKPGTKKDSPTYI